MSITLNGTTGISSTGGIAAADLTGTLPALDGAALTSLTSANLTGALPAIDGSALTGISTTPTTAQVLTATAGAATGAVGTYAFLRTTGNQITVAGTSYAGSSLIYGGVHVNGASVYHSAPGGGVSGTWRAMGQENYSSRITMSVFLRIS